MTAGLTIGARLTPVAVFRVVDKATNGSGVWSRQEFEMQAMCVDTESFPLVMQVSRGNVRGLSETYFASVVAHLAQNRPAPKMRVSQTESGRAVVEALFGQAVICEHIDIDVAARRVRVTFDKTGAVAAVRSEPRPGADGR